MKAKRGGVRAWYRLKNLTFTLYLRLRRRDGVQTWEPFEELEINPVTPSPSIGEDEGVADQAESEKMALEVTTKGEQ
jgi:hypothetical protein